MDEGTRTKSGGKVAKKKASKSAPPPSALHRAKKSGEANGGAKTRKSSNSAAAAATKTAAKRNHATALDNHSNRLTASDHHLSSGLISPGEPNLVFSPCGGDVPSMICDVSPVPSDVESINEAVTKSKGPSLSFHLRTNFNSKQHFDRDKKRHLQSITASRQAPDVANATGVSVRLLPDSASSKQQPPSVPHLQPPTTTKTPARPPKHLAKSMSKLNLTTDHKPKTNERPTLNATAASTKKTPVDVKEAPKAELLSSEEKEAEEEEATAAAASEASAELVIEQPTDGPRLTCSQLCQEFFVEVPSVRLEAAEDEECCKAYQVLRRHGFNVSLHTLRRALLTPTQYRQLRELEAASVDK